MLVKRGSELGRVRGYGREGAEGVGKKERFAHFFMLAAFAGHVCLSEVSRSYPVGVSR